MKLSASGGVSTGLCANQMSGILRRRQLEFDPVLSSFDLHNSFCEALVSDNDLERSAHQVRIVELHTRSFVPIIPEYFEPCHLQFVVELLSDLGGRVRLGAGEKMHMEWRDWERPDNTLRVVVLFDCRSGSAADTDAVASHDRQALFAVKVQERGLHSFTVFGAEHEDMSVFDAFGRL